MAKRPTISDLAEQAGVSVATVDRILNGRMKVREATVERVAAAAQQIGFYAAGLINTQSRQVSPRRTLGFLLQKPDAFYQQFATDLTAAVRDSRAIKGRSFVDFGEELDPSAIARRITSAGCRADALAVVALEHPEVNEAIATLRAKGVPVFTLLSDVTAPECAGHIGADPRKAGRSAAFMITRCSPRPGSIGILIGSHKYLSQALAEISFRTFLREHAPAFKPLEPVLNLDDPGVAYRATVDLIDRARDLVGLYNAGGGMAGMIEAIRERSAGRRLVTVCNELIPATRAALIDGTITLALATPTRRLAELAVDAMINALANSPSSTPRHITVAPDLCISETV